MRCHTGVICAFFLADNKNEKMFGSMAFYV